MQKGLVSEDTSPSALVARNPSASPAENSRSLKLSWRRELNPRPSDYKSDALPAELRQPCSNLGKLSQRQSNCKQLSPSRKTLATSALIRPQSAAKMPYSAAGFENSLSFSSTLWRTSVKVIVNEGFAIDWWTVNGNLMPSTSR